MGPIGKKVAVKRGKKALFSLGNYHQNNWGVQNPRIPSKTKMPKRDEIPRLEEEFNLRGGEAHIAADRRFLE